MRGQFPAFAILLAAAVAVVVARHRWSATHRIGHGGILVGNAAAYDAMSRLVLGSLFGPIAADVAAGTPRGARLLEVGCGPGHLSMLLARQHGLHVTGLDLDPAMIGRARASAYRVRSGGERSPSFLVGDAASLPFPEESFGLVVSTLSMHHWAEPTMALAEIARVLRPDGRALVWDFRPGFPPFHAHHAPNPIEHTQGSPLRVLSATPWRWPWRFKLTQRIELVHADSPISHSET